MVNLKVANFISHISRQMRVQSGCLNSALMMFIVIGGVGGLANAFVNDYALFCVCRFVAAMGLSVPLDRSKNSESDSHSISLKIRTHGTVPRAVHNSRGTGGDQDGHLLVQHVPRPLRARPVRGHHDRLRREGLEDVSGKKSAKVGREEIDPIATSFIQGCQQ